MVIEALRARGARVVAYDPVAMDEARRVFGDDAARRVREVADGRVRRRRRAGRRHRVEGVPQPRLRRASSAACHAAGLRRPQPVRAGVVRAAGLEYFGIGRHDDALQRALRRSRRCASARVLVVGDVMLDRYWFGEVERISPEAPVPVVQDRAHRGAPRRGGQRRAQRRRARRAGDAAVRGRRRRGRARRSRSSSPASACTASLLRDPALPTTVKLRVIGRQQQLLRIDFETAPSHEVLAAKLADYERLRARHRRRDPVRLRQGRPHAHRRHDRPRARGRQAACWSIPRATTTRATAARRCSRPIAPSSARSRAAGRTRRTSPRSAQKLRARPRRSKRCSSRAREEGMTLFTDRGRADDPGAGARGVRRLAAPATP